MKVLGVHDGHLATAALLENGKIKAVISEERLNRIKEWDGFPQQAIQKVLEISRIHPSELDLVVFSQKTKQISADQYLGKAFSMKVIGFNLFKGIFPKPFISGNKWVQPVTNLLALNRGKKDVFPFFRELGVSEHQIIFADHHTCHAYTTLSNSLGKVDRALILTLDGVGDGYCSTVNVLENGAIQWLEKTNIMGSVGLLYNRATQYLNMKPASHEYKVMGLAAYAKEENYREVYRKLSQEYIRINPNNPLRFENISGCVTYDYVKKFKKDFGNVRFDNFAGGLQRFTEELIIKFVQNCIQKTGIDVVFCSGGVFMNIKANMRVMYETDVRDLFIFPSCGDESNSIGACNYGYKLLCDKAGLIPQYDPLENIYFGDEYSNGEILEVLGKYGNKIKYDYIEDIEKHVAEELAKKKIVARFSGRMEFGARALGNRSILAHPGHKDIVREINDAIKMRDFWMPFAGSILKEDQDNYLVNPKKIKAPYMVLGFKTKVNARDEIPSVLHPYDLTCRPQIIAKDHNPRYYQLIEHFKSLTGIGCVLNTSFNIHGSPMVHSPVDALETLLESDLRYLAMENYYVEKK